MSEGWSRETKVMDFLEKTICDELRTRQLRTEISSFLLEPAPNHQLCLKEKVQKTKRLSCTFCLLPPLPFFFSETGFLYNNSDCPGTQNFVDQADL